MTGGLPRWGLRRRIVVVAGLGLVLAILATMVASRVLATGLLLQAQQDRGQAVAEGLAVQLQRILALGLRIDEVQGFDAQCREAIAAHRGLAYVLVLAPDGTALAEAVADGQQAPPAAEVQQALARHGTRPPVLADGSHAVAVPVSDLTRSIVAQVVVGVPGELLAQAQSELLRTQVAVGLLTAAVALGLLWLAMSRLVTRPLASLVQAMNTIDPARPHAVPEVAAVRNDPDLVAIHDAGRRLIARIAEHEAELVQARDQALQASRLKSEFLAVMSHELRTPLNAMLGMTQLLALTPLDDLQQRYVGHARQGGDALLALVNDVLDLASIEAGKLQLHAQPVALQPLLASVAEWHAGRARDKGLVLSAELDTALPPWVQADPQRLRQMVDHLLANAVKFTERGEVRLRAEPAAGGIRITVSDSGPGIPAAFQPHLFEAFRQADASSHRRHGGTGLGLAIVHRLAQAMGGQVLAQSVDGHGATFTLELPLPSVAAPAPAEGLAV